MRIFPSELSAMATVGSGVAVGFAVAAVVALLAPPDAPPHAAASTMAVKAIAAMRMSLPPWWLVCGGTTDRAARMSALYVCTFGRAGDPMRRADRRRRLLGRELHA